MTAGRSTMKPMIVACGLLLTLPGLTMAQDVPQTAWGAPDLQGVWDFRTITPLQRPEDLGDQAFLTAEEAAQREKSAVDRAATLWDREARPTEAGGNVGGYNNFWMDQGTNVIGTRRTSLIIDPPNGRLPEVTEAGQSEGGSQPRVLQLRASGVIHGPEQLRSLPDGLQRRTAHHAGCLQPERAAVPTPEYPRDADRDGAHRACHSARRYACAGRRSPPVVRRVAWALGRRDPRG